MAGAAGGLTMTIKKSSVVEDDVQDDGIRAGAVVPLPMSARVTAGWQKDRAISQEPTTLHAKVPGSTGRGARDLRIHSTHPPPTRRAETQRPWSHRPATLSCARPAEMVSKGTGTLERDGHHAPTACRQLGRPRSPTTARGLLVRDALVSALVCVCVAVTRWFRACLLCLPWLSCVSCVAAFGCNAVSCDFV